MFRKDARTLLEPCLIVLTGHLVCLSIKDHGREFVFEGGTERRESFCFHGVSPVRHHHPWKADVEYMSVKGDSTLV